MPLRILLCASVLLSLLTTLATAAAPVAMAAGPDSTAAGPDWSAVSEVQEIDVLTTNEDGSAKDTVIWLAVLDEHGYIRTSQSSSWGGNVERNPDVALRIEGTEYPVRATFIEDEALRERIVAAFREKYGWTDGALNFIRGSSPRIMRVDPR